MSMSVGIYSTIGPRQLTKRLNIRPPHDPGRRSRKGAMMTSQSVALPSEPFGVTSDGRAATLFTLENPNLRVQITDFGGRMVRIQAPDRNGRRGDVLLGFGDVGTYIRAGGAFGA